MQKYICLECGYIYYPEDGDSSNDIPPGTPFDDLPDGWRCPQCGEGEEYFQAYDGK